MSIFTVAAGVRLVGLQPAAAKSTVAEGVRLVGFEDSSSEGGGGEKRGGRRGVKRHYDKQLRDGEPTEFFLFLFSSLLPITPNSKCYRSQAVIESGLLITLVPRYKS